jgi:hypothetical protein
MKNMIDIVSTSITKNWNEVLIFFLLSWLFCFGFSCVLILEKPKLYMQHRSKEKVVLHIAYHSFGSICSIEVTKTIYCLKKRFWSACN